LDLILVSKSSIELTWDATHLGYKKFMEQKSNVILTLTEHLQSLQNTETFQFS